MSDESGVETYLPAEQQARMAIDAQLAEAGWVVQDANLPPPEVIAQEIVEDLEAALAEFAEIAESLSRSSEGR